MWHPSVFLVRQSRLLIPRYKLILEFICDFETLCSTILKSYTTALRTNCLLSTIGVKSVLSMLMTEYFSTYYPQTGQYLITHLNNICNRCIRRCYQLTNHSLTAVVVAQKIAKNNALMYTDNRMRIYIFIQRLTGLVEMGLYDSVWSYYKTMNGMFCWL